MISVLEPMKTFSEEDGLTEEAVVTKLRTCQCHHLYLHSSLRNNSSGWHFLMSYMPMHVDCLDLVQILRYYLRQEEIVFLFVEFIYIFMFFVVIWIFA